MDLYIMFNYLLVSANFLMVVVPVLLAVALLTLLERKVLSYMQFRKGPNLVGPLGIFQPMADGLKLFIKESISPLAMIPFLFFMAPALFFFMALLLWGVVPVFMGAMNIKLSLLFVMAFSSLAVYAILGAGWASKSKYALLGAIRGVAQAISYEVSFGLILLPLVLVVGGWKLGLFNYSQAACWFMFPLLPLFIMWFISSLAETNRAPFDLTEGESELVSGYKVEFSGAPFALFFIGEYAKMILIKLMSVIMFFGAGTPFSSMVLLSGGMAFKCCLLIGLFLWIRASFPRVRYDQLMDLMWKGLLPLSIGLLMWLYFLIASLYGVASHY